MRSVCSLWNQRIPAFVTHLTLRDFLLINSRTNILDYTALQDLEPLAENRLGYETQHENDYRIVLRDIEGSLAPKLATSLTQLRTLSTETFDFASSSLPLRHWSYYPHLTHLSILNWNTRILESIRYLTALNNLRSLKLATPFPSTFSHFHALTRIQHLSLRFLENLDKFTSLHSLTLIRGHQTTTPFPPNLTSLTLIDCEKTARNLKPSELPHLLSLTLKLIYTLPPLHLFTTLTELDIDEVIHLPTKVLKTLTSLSSLTSLAVEGEVRKILPSSILHLRVGSILSSSLKPLTSLQSLVCTESYQIPSILSTITLLTKLVMIGIISPSTPHHYISEMTRLCHLEFDLKAFGTGIGSGISHLTSLTVLHARRRKFLPSDLAPLTRLRSLHIANASELPTSLLLSLTNLEILSSSLPLSFRIASQLPLLAPFKCESCTESVLNESACYKCGMRFNVTRCKMCMRAVGHVVCQTCIDKLALATIYVPTITKGGERVRSASE